MSDIKFTLGPNHFGDGPTRSAVIRFLGISDDHLANLIRRGESLTITATAAQFGMFIAGRAINGCTGNTILNMHPEFVTPPTCNRPVLYPTTVDIRQRG